MASRLDVNLNEGLHQLQGEKISTIYRYKVPSLRDYAPHLDTKTENIRYQEVHSVIAKVRDFGYNKTASDEDYVLLDGQRNAESGKFWSRSFLAAGPRPQIYFDPKTNPLNAAVVCSGQLCPGINTVIRGITQTLVHLYGVSKVYGVRGGFLGFGQRDPSHPLGPIELRTENLRDIHHQGGSFIGSSKSEEEGRPGTDEILDWLMHFNISQLYIIGGLNSHRVAVELCQKIKERKLILTVACVPKSISDDFGLLDRSFGHDTAVQEACRAIASAKAEASCNKPNGMGIVHLMGKEAGFIAAHSVLSSGDVDLCLIPEAPIEWEGTYGCLPHLKKVMEKQGHAVIVVARGAGGRDYMKSIQNEPAARASSQEKAKVGILVKYKIEEYFKKQGEVATIKFIEPSYKIRSVPANAFDALYCLDLANSVVHGAMAGYTAFSVGSVNNTSVYIPCTTLMRYSPAPVDINGRTYERVLSITGQPNTIRKPPSRLLSEGSEKLQLHKL